MRKVRPPTPGRYRTITEAEKNPAVKSDGPYIFWMLLKLLRVSWALLRSWRAQQRRAAPAGQNRKNLSGFSLSSKNSSSVWSKSIRTCSTSRIWYGASLSWTTERSRKNQNICTSWNTEDGSQQVRMDRFCWVRSHSISFVSVRVS